MWEDEKRNQVGYNEEMFEGDAPSGAPLQPAAPHPAGQEPLSLLERQLAPGEQLVWWGQPKKLHGPRSGMQRLFAVVFLVGHTFNLAINLLGAYVHTCRLQYVEFFGKFYEGGGKEFTPFRSNTKYVDIKGGK